VRDVNIMGCRYWTKFVMCGILFVGGRSFLSAQSATAPPAFAKDIAPIIYQHCASCHRVGEIAPMPLLSYEEVRPWAASIREEVATGAMPPWHSAAPRGQFSNDRRLSDPEKELIMRWVAAGSPKGNVKDLPPLPVFPDNWQIGTPDAVITMAEPFTVPAAGVLPYQNFTIPTNFTEDKWVQAIEVRPGTRAVVHHILVFVSGQRPNEAYTQTLPQRPRRTRTGTQGPGSKMADTLFATTAPGTNAMIFQPGTAMRVPAGASIRFQIHYTTNGKEVSDRSSVGMIFAKQPPVKEMHTSAFFNPLLVLPAGAADAVVPSAIQFDENVHLTALFPHTHLRGKSWDYKIVYPDGRTETVLPIPHYDFNWQTYYTFTNPLAVPKGSKLEALAHYDNSANNKSNPDPTKEVHWGEQTWDEMQYTGINYTIDDRSSGQLSQRD
jgi:Copper type II ascorbate-dependent monooxygenase, C-terminal domain